MADGDVFFYIGLGLEGFVDKSKSILQQELDKAQMLFDSLMQEYFG